MKEAIHYLDLQQKLKKDDKRQNCYDIDISSEREREHEREHNFWVNAVDCCF